MKKEKSQDMAFSKTLTKEKEEQVKKKLEFKKQVQKTREDLKVREDKLRVDVQKFDKQERQQKLLNKELSMLCQPSTGGSSNHSRDRCGASGTSKSSEARTKSSETSREPDRRKGSICQSGIKCGVCSQCKYAIFCSSRFLCQKVPYFNVLRQNVTYFNVLQKGVIHKLRYHFWRSR